MEKTIQQILCPSDDAGFGRWIEFPVNNSQKEREKLRSGPITLSH